MAQLAPADLDDPTTSLAGILKNGDPRDTIATVLGHAPKGFIPALNRLGPDAMSSPEKYEKFFSIFIEAQHRPRLKAMGHLGRLTEEKLDVLHHLDPALLHVSILKREMTMDQAQKINVALTAIRSATAPSDEASLIDASTGGGVCRSAAQFVASWVKRCRLAPLPVSADPLNGAYPVETAAGLMEASVRFKNCARSMHRVIDAIAGRAGYVVHELNGKPIAMTALVCFEDGRWAVENVYGPGNQPVPQAVQQSIRTWFVNQGVLTTRRRRLEPCWATTLDLLGLQRWNGFGDLIEA